MSRTENTGKVESGRALVEGEDDTPLPRASTSTAK